METETFLAFGVPFINLLIILCFAWMIRDLE